MEEKGKIKMTFLQNRILNYAICYLLIFIISQSNAIAYGPPDYLPNGTHPRIYLNIAEDLALLVNKRDTQSPEWIALETWCDAHINDAGYNIHPADQSKNDLSRWKGNFDYTSYRMGGFATHLYNYALAYQVIKQAGSKQNTAKASTYAARAKTLLIDGIATALSVGEEQNGLHAIRVGELHDVSINADEATILGIGRGTYKVGYSSRHLMAVPVAYDWIYDTLSTTEKSTLSKIMLRWFDWLRGVRSTYNNGILINGIRYYEDRDGNCNESNNCTSLSGTSTNGYGFGNIANNFGGGHDGLLLLIGVATYGDVPESANYFSILKSHMLTNTIEPLENDLKHAGGDSPEGWNYGGGFVYSLRGLYGYATATGDPIVQNMQWPSKLIMAATYRVSSDFLTIPLYGYWTGIPLGQARMNMLSTFVGIEQRLRPNSDMSKLGQFLLDTPDYVDTYTEWENLFFTKQGIPSSSPATLNLPLSYLAKGNGLFATRSSWTDANASHFTVRLEGKVSVSHDGYDEGHFSLLRGQDRLLDHDNKSDAPPSTSFNTIVFNNTSHYANNPIQLSPSIDRIKDGHTYAYVSGDITNAFKRQWKQDGAKLFRRSVLHIRPDIYVIYDITQSNADIGNLKDWYTQYNAEPQISGNTISINNGNSRAYIKTIFPSDGTYTKTNTSANFWRVKYTPAILQEYDQFLHVVEATSATGNQLSATPVNANGGRGVLVGATIAIFTDDLTGSNIDTVSYTTNATVHYIADLPPSTKISITRDNASIGEPTTDSAGIVEFSTPSGQANYVIQSLEHIKTPAKINNLQIKH